MSYHLNVSKLIRDLKGPKGKTALSEEIKKISTEIESIKNTVKPQAEAKIKEVQIKLKGLKKNFKTAQKEVEKELNKRIKSIKKSAVDVEKKLEKTFNKLKPVKNAAQKAKVKTKTARKQKV